MATFFTNPMLRQDDGGLSKWLSGQAPFALPTNASADKEFYGESVRDQEGRKHLIKEFTEYSANELALIFGDSDSLPFERSASDDYQQAGAIEQAVDISKIDMDRRLIIKEFTEYSERERATLFQQQEAHVENDTSDDFVAMAPSEEGRKHLIKEHTEYSPDEWKLISAEAGADALAVGKSVSDDFQNAGPIEENMDSSEAALVKRLVIKEFMEYSERERATLFERQEPHAESSDDFAMAPGAAAFCAWYGACCTQNPEIPKKRTRRVYHNRRKTAWTDYDVEPEEGDAVGSASNVPPPPVPHVVPFSELVEFLKSGDGLTREVVRDKVLMEATKYQGGVAAALKATGPCSWPPLLVAVQRKLPEAVAALLELGADVECKGACCGWTPLMYAAQSGKKEVVMELLKGGANLNASAPRDSWTPLCSAILSGSTEMVKLFLSKGANLQIIKKCHPAIASTYQQEMAH